MDFSFTAAQFDAPNDCRLRYQLLGYETAWHDAGARRQAFYTSLAPGAYRFRVVAADPAGFWSGTPADFAFTLAPFVWQTWWFWSLVGLAAAGLTTAIVYWRIWELRRVQRLQAAVDLAQERVRIAQDLHDGLGSGLTQLRLLATLAEREQSAQSPAPHLSHVRELARRANEVASTLRDIIWVARPESATVRSLIDRVCDHAQKHLPTADIDCRFDLPHTVPDAPLGDATTQNLFFAAREALTNILKHSQATQATLRLTLDDHSLTLEITDNGVGLPPAPNRPTGVGLASMRRRLEAVGGHCDLSNPPPRGTRVTFRVPRPRPEPRPG
jgi:signal transduction histidine kinase